jgi:hypothetical protein
MDQNELLIVQHHLGVPSGASKPISELMVRLAKPRTYLALTLTLSPKRKK